jgi:fumarate reductase flavoprotein subunit
VGNVDKTGDGIRMAWEAGAADEGKSLLELYRAGPAGPDFSLGNQIEFAVTQPDLWVDPKGERFCDESICFYDSSVGNANARFKEGYTWSIFDDGIIKRILERGVDKNVAIDSMPGSKPTDIYREIKASLDKKSTEVVEADSVEALAAKMGVSPAVLKTTIEEYNAACEKKYDEQFAKDPRYLWPIKGPKYYAVKARTVFLGTMGGIKINEKAEAIDKKDTVLPGLYAAGFDAGGMYGDSYPIKCSSGLASAFALNSGRMAGKNALKFLGR